MNATTFLAAACCSAFTLPSGAQDGSALSPRHQEVEAARDRLREAWEDFAEQNARGELKPDRWAKRLQPKILMKKGQEALRAGAAPWSEPDTVRSVNGTLTVTLTVERARNTIGGDPVELRNYNGKLAGPTLRCKPGDTLRITVDNRLAPEPYMPGAMNTLHGFDTTNLHTHGLHVSPSGNSDNVLLQVEPASSQTYEIALPASHPCGSFWYHAHLHGSTAANVGSGLSGALIVEGGIDTIPEIAAAKERVLLLQQIPYVNNATKPVCPEIPADKDLSVGVVEPEYQDCSFGPGTWDKLGRFTTINGVKLPLIQISPGAVERWRLVDSAIREVIQPQLVLMNRRPGAPALLPMNEIAVDGLPLGRVAPRTCLELWPGYRSDVLVQAPMSEGSLYVLRDARVVKNPIPEERRWLAVVEIAGAPQPMKLPSDAQLAPFRLASIDPATVTAREVMAFGIIPRPAGQSGVVFTVDRTPFGNDEARQITLNEVQEWTLISRNNVGPVSHPFHIHVNPFEIFSMVNEKGEEQLDRDPSTGVVLPVWRDTIILNEGWKVSTRTTFTDFTGVYVQHCHILDHEDQGMMELIQINAPLPPAAKTADAPARPLRPYPAPGWTLPDAQGREVALAELRGGPVLLVFFEGLGCVRCNEQLQKLAAEYDSFSRLGVKLIAVSIDSTETLATALSDNPFPFPVLADPRLKTFRAYGCYMRGPMHGMFLLDAAGAVQWQTVSRLPWTDFDSVRGEISRLQKAEPVTATTR